LPNQNPEQIARDHIDATLVLCGWLVQSKAKVNLGAGPGVAVREYQTDIGPADYVLFVDGKPVGVIEAKREEEAQTLNEHEDQAEGYAAAKLKFLNNEKLPFVYVSTGDRTRFTDFRDPKPRAREVFAFHRPETLRGWLRKPDSLRGSLQHLGDLATEGLRDCQVTAITQLEASFRAARPRALIQMATGAGKTFTAISFVYPLPRRYQKLGRAGRAGVHGLPAHRRQPTVHRAVRRAPNEEQTPAPGQLRLHQHHPKAVRCAQRRRPRRE
jgi:type I restriction enzyme R subunit